MRTQTFETSQMQAMTPAAKPQQAAVSGPGKHLQPRRRRCWHSARVWAGSRPKPRSLSAARSSRTCARAAAPRPPPRASAPARGAFGCQMS